MSDFEKRAIYNAAASSAMEELPLNEKDISVVRNILEGKMTLEDFFQSVKAQYQEG